MIKVLVVDDSRVAQELLVHILSSDPGVEVVGVVADGREALPAVQEKRPDVVTMDIHMPAVDGFEATRRIMAHQPTPIVIVSGSSGATEVAGSFRAVEAGALAVVRRPPGLTHPGFAAAARELLQTVKLMAEVKVVRRRSLARREGPPGPPGQALPDQAGPGIEMVAVGASAGGPQALQALLSALPPDLSAPVLIVQHITPGFVEGFVEWLAAASGFPLRLASAGESPRPGHGYVAPDGRHLGVEAGPRLILGDQPPENGFRPSVAHLFRSVGRVFGPRAAGVLLTGMGRDGVEEMKALKDLGAVTIAQDEASSLIHGMPGAAISRDAATHVLPPEGIAALLTTMAGQAKRRSP